MADRRSSPRPAEAAGERRQQEDRRFGLFGRPAAGQKPPEPLEPESPTESATHRRTCVVVSAEVHNRLAAAVVLVPVTTDLEEKGKILRPLITASRNNGLRADSLALCDQPVTVPLSAIEGPFGRIDPEALELVRGRLGWVLGIQA